MSDLVLPAFELDCREWMVVSPTEAGLPEVTAGAPLLAVLSTLVIDDDLSEATGSLTVGILDDDLDLRAIAPESPAQELVDGVLEPGRRRYVVPSPNADRLALVAEFSVPESSGAVFEHRVEALMTSFRWQTA